MTGDANRRACRCPYLEASAWLVAAWIQASASTQMRLTQYPRAVITPYRRLSRSPTVCPRPLGGDRKHARRPRGVRAAAGGPDVPARRVSSARTGPGSCIGGALAAHAFADRTESHQRV